MERYLQTYYWGNINKMAKTKGFTSSIVATKKGTSIGRNPSTATMNKDKKRAFKKYRGQGK